MEFHEIRHLLADKKAIDTILALPAQVIDGVVWRNIDGDKVVWEVKYLRIRGLLCHNKQQPYLVKLKDHDEQK